MQVLLAAIGSIPALAAVGLAFDDEPSILGALAAVLLSGLAAASAHTVRVLDESGREVCRRDGNGIDADTLARLPLVDRCIGHDAPAYCRSMAVAAVQVM